jgi:hypothetical protein
VATSLLPPTRVLAISVGRCHSVDRRLRLCLLEGRPVCSFCTLQQALTSFYGRDDGRSWLLGAPSVAGNPAFSGSGRRHYRWGLPQLLRPSMPEGVRHVVDKDRAA